MSFLFSTKFKPDIYRKFSSFLLFIVFFFACIPRVFAFSSPSIEWKTNVKDKNIQIGVLTVPLDYSNPGLGTIKINVARHLATKYKIGTLYFNNGGPWSPTVPAIEPESFLTPTWLDHFDLVTFDPRGLGKNPITCNPKDKNLYDSIITNSLLNRDSSSISGIKNLYNDTKKLRDLCNYQRVAYYAGSKYTLEDLNQFRIALGVDKIDYLGGSYGTRLGLAYLLKYPEHVNRMVLDGNLPPDNNWYSFLETSATGLDSELKQFFKFCSEAKQDCPLYDPSYELETPDGMIKAYEKLVHQARETGIPTSKTYFNRPVGIEMIQNYLGNGYLYQPYATDDSGNKYSDIIAKALYSAIVDNNGDMLMNLFMNNDSTPYRPKKNSFLPRLFSNLDEIETAVFCKDFIINPSIKKEEWLDKAKGLIKNGPLLGGSNYIREDLVQCVNSPVLDSDPLIPTIEEIKKSNISFDEISAKVLLFGNKYDGYTPMKNTVSVYHFLTDVSKFMNIKVQLVEWLGLGHITSNNAPSDGCSSKALLSFFLDGNLPKHKLVCDDEINPFLRSN